MFSLYIIKKLRWDKNEGDFLHFLKLLPDEGIVLDIGANIGVMSYYLANGFPRREVYAFEPIPYNFDNLQRIKNKYKLNNLHTCQLALGEEDGQIEMVLPIEKSVRFHGLAHVKHESIQEKNQGESFSCPIRQLDTMEEFKAISSPLSGIKIDVENFEYFVLKGGEQLLKKHMPIIYCELWDNNNRIKTFEFLKTLGYQTLVLENTALVPWNVKTHTGQNFFFCPNSVL